MAQTAWVTMTRGKAERQPPNTAQTRVDAGVKELNEMTIGRTDDPEIPLPAKAFRSRKGVWDWIADPIWASGHEPHKQMPWGPAAGNLKSSPVASPKDPSNDTNARCASPSGCT
jgi:hypothetical protein